MKRTLTSALIAATVAFGAGNASAAEIIFDPNTQYYDVNGVSKLSLWGVPEAGGQALWADARESWHTELSVASWTALLLRAQQMNMRVGVGYNPDNFEIWYIAKPRY